ncbi:crossover junction endodeoxyribonuclease RuvC [Patescibacteria group bacterium]|nr:crossover junction endodeoxyribonuclease RuvC [Patescibacteria group bacterium]MBU1867906.1 crossover junction endodeoxyribonuclease RuvC [Patescibacteria group bacterium]
MKSNTQGCVTVLGIDPGLATTGWGIIETQNSPMGKPTGQAPLKTQNYGVIKTASKNNLGLRLEKIYSELNQLIKRYGPDIVAVEKLFFGKNAKTAMLVGEARGVIILVSQKHKLDILEYTPLQIKLATCGYGQAGKQQVQKMVKQLLNLQEIPRPDDAADALAVAYTAIVNAKFKIYTEHGT